MTKDLWYFPRKDFAQDVFATLIGGPSHALVLNGPRRSGKTSFLLKDIAPLADKDGHKTVYASFWENTAPTHVLLAAIYESLQKKGQLPSRLSALSSVARLVQFAGVEMKLDFSPHGATDPSAELRVLDAVLGALDEPGRPVILLLDEFGATSKTDAHAVFLAGLRTALDKRRDGIRTIFTGSSQRSLNRIFADREAPFFRFATPISLPPLGSEFVRHQLDAFGQTFRRELSEADALAAFEALDGNPGAFLIWLQKSGFEADLAPADVLKQMQQDAVTELRFDDTWLELSPMRRAILRVIAEGVDKLYGQDASDLLEHLTDGQAPSNPERQTSLRLFLRRGLVDKQEDTILMVHPLVRDWVLDRPDSEFRD